MFIRYHRAIAVFMLICGIPFFLSACVREQRIYRQEDGTTKKVVTHKFSWKKTGQIVATVLLIAVVVLVVVAAAQQQKQNEQALVPQNNYVPPVGPAYIEDDLGDCDILAYVEKIDEYHPPVAGNGSYFGQPNAHGVPRVVFVRAHMHGGHWKRSHYRALPNCPGY